MNIAEKWREFVDKMNSAGIPLPMVRDPKTKEGSVTVSLVVMSSFLCTLTIGMMLASIISKLTGYFIVNDSTMNMMREAFYSSIQLFIASLGGYLGRKFQRDSKGNASLEAEDKKP